MDYTPLRIKTVEPNRELTFDLFIHYKDHYLCYAEKGNLLTEDKLEKLINQKMATFFVPEDQIDNVHLYLDSVVNEALCSETLSAEEKVEKVSEVAAHSLERMTEVPDQKNYKVTQKAALGLRAVIKNNPQALKRLFGKRAEETDFIINHSINVCALSTRLAENLRLKDEEVESIATAALIHDIGLTSFDASELELFHKDPLTFTPEERLIYGKHTKTSRDLFADKPFVTKEIEDLIVHHEEDLTGEGPLKVKKLTLLQECLSLCNAFDKRLHTKKESPEEAYKVFQLDYIGRYNLDLIQKFEKVLKEEGLLK